MTSKFIPGGDPRQQMQAKAPDLSLATDIVCENCGNYTFQEVMLLKKFSALVSPSGKDSIMPIPTMACNACGFVNAMFQPQVTRTATSTEETAPTEPTKPSLILEK